MAITFIASNVQDTGAGLSLTFSVPATAQADDFMLAFVKQSENTTGREWDDDGGGGNGWTRLAYNRTTSGRDQETALYWKIHSGSEANPTFTWASGVTSEPMSGSLLVYRGTDTANPIQDFGFLQAPNDANPPNPSVNLSNSPSTIIALHAATHDDISSVAPPTGYTLRTQVWSGTANDHRNHFTSDLIGSVATGTYTPPDWQHGVLNTTPEYHTYTVALQEPVLIAVDDFNTTETFVWGATGLSLTGFGFEATQASGKVEFWSDSTGTTKTAQTVNAWSDTSIQIDTVQGALANNTSLYLVVTNDNGDESTPLLVQVGIAPYKSFIQSLFPDHYIPFDNNYNDIGITGPVRNATSSVVGTHTFQPAISEDTSFCFRLGSVTDRREMADSPNMNITIDSSARTIMMWISLGVIQQSLGAIWKEGGGVQNLAFLLGIGNVLMAQMADSTSKDNVQAISDFRLDIDRPYNILMRYSYADNGFHLYIDGKIQTVTDGNPIVFNFDSHSGDIVFGDPDTNLETGGTDIAYAGMEDCKIAHFGSWSDNSANTGGLTQNEIESIFLRGATPTVTITSDTQSNMQAQLDAIADTVRPNSPLAIRVEEVTGGGDLELVADNITFDDRITQQLEFRGSGTLTWVNENGSNLNVNKTYSLVNGTVNVIESVPVAVNVLDITTKLPIEGARVRLTEGSTVRLEGLTDASGSLSSTFRYSSDTPLSGKVRKSSSPIYYKTSNVSATITSSGLSQTVFMVRD